MFSSRLRLDCAQGHDISYITIWAIQDLLQSRLSLFVLALSFGSCEDLLASEIADAFEHTALGKLATDTCVDTVLNGVDILVSSDLGLVHLICNPRSAQAVEPVFHLHTFGNIAGLVLAHPSKVLVLNPWHPALVLLVVIVPCRFHCDWVRC
jgi:hypothetical protein